MSTVPRIWDTVLLGGELDMLELRLRHLDSAVYRHVIVEADVTFAGQYKPLSFPSARERFEPWLDKIVYIPVRMDELPQGTDLPYSSPEPVTGMCERAWAREHAQRDALWRGMHGCQPDDLVLVGDLDEIPDLGVLAGMVERPPVRPVCLAMKICMFAVDWQHPRLGLNTIVIARGQLRSFSEGMIREKHTLARAEYSGHHFTWVGGRAAISRKAAAHAHQEISTKITVANMNGEMWERGWCPWDQVQLAPVDVDGKYPEWIKGRECPPEWFRPR